MFILSLNVFTHFSSYFFTILIIVQLVDEYCCGKTMKFAIKL